MIPAILGAALVVRGLGAYTLRRAANRAATALGLQRDAEPSRWWWLVGVDVHAHGPMHLAGKTRRVELRLAAGRDRHLTWTLNVEASTDAPLCVVRARSGASDEANERLGPPLPAHARTTPQDLAALSAHLEAYAAAIAALPADAEEIRLGRGAVSVAQRVGARDPCSPHAVARLAHAVWLIDAATSPDDARP